MVKVTIMFPSLLSGTEPGLKACVIDDLATALGEDAATVGALVKTANPSVVRPSWIVLAVMHALWRKANVAPEITASVLNAWPEIPASLEEILCFRMNDSAEESDPFLLFHPSASQSIPIPAIDEYIDLVQNRFFIWRRPAVDRTQIAKGMIEGSSPDSGRAYIESLNSLVARPSYDSIRLGFTDGRHFFRSEGSQKDSRPKLASSVFEIEHCSSSFESSYDCKTSVNVSIAAREAKRRALGLNVVSMSAVPPAGHDILRRRGEILAAGSEPWSSAG
ncbi:MAG: hypothetical protein ACJLUP_06320 [Agrobacterium tumefaciens]